MSRLIKSFDILPLSHKERGERLNAGNYRLADWAPVLLPEIGESLKRMFLLAKILTPEELGYPTGATWRQIVGAAREQDLDFVPQELVPGLRLAYASRYANDYVRIAHQPIIGLGGREFRFGFRDDGELFWLHGRETGGDEAFWPADFQFLFMWGCEEYP